MVLDFLTSATRQQKHRPHTLSIFPMISLPLHSKPLLLPIQELSPVMITASTTSQHKHGCNAIYSWSPHNGFAHLSESQAGNAHAKHNFANHMGSICLGFIIHMSRSLKHVVALLLAFLAKMTGNVFLWAWCWMDALFLLGHDWYVLLLHVFGWTQNCSLPCMSSHLREFVTCLLGRWHVSCCIVFGLNSGFHNYACKGSSSHTLCMFGQLSIANGYWCGVCVCVWWVVLLHSFGSQLRLSQLCLQRLKLSHSLHVWPTQHCNVNIACLIWCAILCTCVGDQHTVTSAIFTMIFWGV